MRWFRGIEDGEGGRVVVGPHMKVVSHSIIGDVCGNSEGGPHQVED